MNHIAKLIFESIFDDLAAAEKEADKEIAKKSPKKTLTDKEPSSSDDEYGSMTKDTIKKIALAGSRRAAEYKAEKMPAGRKIKGKGYGTGDYSDTDTDEKPDTAEKKYKSDELAKVLGLTPKKSSVSGQQHSMDAPKTSSESPAYLQHAQSKVSAAKSTGEKERATKELKSFHTIHDTFKSGGIEALKAMHAENANNKNVQARIQTAIEHHSNNK